MQRDRSRLAPLVVVGVAVVVVVAVAVVVAVVVGVVVAVAVGVAVVVGVVVVVAVAVAVGVAVVVGVAVAVGVQLKKYGGNMEISRDDIIQAVVAKMFSKDGEPHDGHGFFIRGDSYFIRCLTYHYVGRVARILPGGIVLVDALWVADSGRWNNALVTGELKEVEPFPSSVYINTASIVDATPWLHELPKEVK